MPLKNDENSSLYPKKCDENSGQSNTKRNNTDMESRWYHNEIRFNFEVKKNMKHSTILP